MSVAHIYRSHPARLARAGQGTRTDKSLSWTDQIGSLFCDHCCRSVCVRPDKAGKNAAVTNPQTVQSLEFEVSSDNSLVIGAHATGADRVIRGPSVMTLLVSLEVVSWKRDPTNVLCKRWLRKYVTTDLQSCNSNSKVIRVTEEVRINSRGSCRVF